MEQTAALKALAALAQGSRLTLFRLLVQQGPQGLTPGAMTETLEIPAPTLSFHLKELTNARLISARQDGRFIVYSADFSTMRELVEFLYHNCCGTGVAACDNEPAPAFSTAAPGLKLKPSRSRK